MNFGFRYGVKFMAEAINEFSCTVDVTNKLVYSIEARGAWCALPYPDHPKGCPNLGGDRISCPPNAPLVCDFIDLEKSHWFTFVTFDLGSHVDSMKKKHRKWTDRQARCVLYWQGGVRKRLRQVVEGCEVFDRGNTIYTMCPEAMGINVIETLQRLNVPIREKPLDIVYKVALLGHRK